jgi:hypothetical protein
MTPAAIIKEAMADGVNLVLSHGGTIRATGEQVAVNHWLPIIRDNKSAIVSILRVANASQWREFESLLAIVGPAYRTPEDQYPLIREVAGLDMFAALLYYRDLAKQVQEHATRETRGLCQ